MLPYVATPCRNLNVFAPHEFYWCVQTLQLNNLDDQFSTAIFVTSYSYTL